MIQGFKFHSNNQETIELYDYNSLQNLPQSDKTLSVDGSFADGKATGDAIINLKNILRSRFAGKKLSIIGDSIDTFNQDGYKIAGYRMYYPALDVTDVNQTWWKQVLDNSGMTLEVNASWSGSRVTNTLPAYPDFYDRISLIGSPDVIFITLGTNDSSGSVELGEYDFSTNYTNLSESTFRTAYIKGIKALQTLYPSAEIICISEQMKEEYRESIEYIAKSLSVEYINASDYIGSAGVHPGILGMRQIASLVLYPTDNGLWQEHYPADAAKVGILDKSFNINRINQNNFNELKPILIYGGISSANGNMNPINSGSYDSYSVNDRIRINGVRKLKYIHLKNNSLFALVFYYKINGNTITYIGRSTDWSNNEYIFADDYTYDYCAILFKTNSTITMNDVRLNVEIYADPLSYAIATSFNNTENGFQTLSTYYTQRVITHFIDIESNPYIFMKNFHNIRIVYFDATLAKQKIESGGFTLRNGKIPFESYKYATVIFDISNETIQSIFNDVLLVDKINSSIIEDLNNANEHLEQINNNIDLQNKNYNKQYESQRINDANLISFNNGANLTNLDQMTINFSTQSNINKIVCNKTGKNMLNVTLENLKKLNTTGTWTNNIYTNNNLTYTIELDENNNVNKIIVNGTNGSSNNWFTVAEGMHIREDVCFTGQDANSGGGTHRLQVSSSAGNSYYGNGSIIPNGSILTNILIRIASNYTATNVVFEPMIRLASDRDSSFEPYYGEKYEINLPIDVMSGVIDVINGIITVENIQYQISKTNIKIFSGINRIWTDIGTISIKYRKQKTELNEETFIYSGKHINTFKIKPIELPAWYYAQDGAVYSNYIVRFTSNGKVYIIDINTGGLVDSCEIASNIPHANSVFFGNEKYDNNDTFPIIYANRYNNEPAQRGVLYGYRLHKVNNTLTATLITTITIGFTNDSLWTTGNDSRAFGNFLSDGTYLWAYTTLDGDVNKTRFFKFNMPSIANSTVELTTENMIDYFDTDKQSYPQGCAYYSGMAFCQYGWDGDMNVIDLETKETISKFNFRNTFIAGEPELIDFYNGNIIYANDKNYAIIKL